MAANVESVQYAAHNTIDADTVDTITLLSYAQFIQIIHRDTTDPFYVRTGATAAGTVDPVEAANENYIVMPGATLTLPWPATAVGQAVVKLLCTNSKAYSVQGVPGRAW